MFNDVQCAGGSRSRLRPWLAGGALVLSVGIAIGCGDSSDDKASAPTAKAATTTKAAPAATTPAATTPAATTPTTTTAAKPLTAPDAKKYLDGGTVRLMAKRLGTPGTLVVVKPKGIVDSHNERWYTVGTKITLRASSTKTAKFAGWSQGCTNKNPVCTVTVKPDAYTRVFALFKLDQKAAAKLKPSDPALKSGIFALGSGPED
jgi:pyruvate/2-oxoglutarate dehydrogenase complex dihydrolipoamide acyltransferase (E2) component